MYNHKYTAVLFFGGELSEKVNNKNKSGSDFTSFSRAFGAFAINYGWSDLPPLVVPLFSLEV